MRLFLLAVLLVLPAFFAAAEVSLLRLRPSRVELLVEEGHAGAQAIQRLQRRLRRALMVSQLGATLALVALGWAGRGLGGRLWSDGSLGVAWRDASLFVLIVLLATFLGGLLPKAWVLNRPEKAALRLAPLLEVVMRCLAPLLNLLEAVAGLLMRLLGLAPQWDVLVPALSAGELETLVESGRVTGLFPDERNILEGVFALRDTQVREVMVPRSGMVTLPASVCFAELMEAVHHTRHARFPVIGESLDDVRGVLDLRQMAEPIARGQLESNSPLEPYLQPAVRVLETSTLAELLPMIRSGQPLLLVVDEHGGTEGLVTAADLTGEIVGDDVQDETDEPELQAEEGRPGSWLVAGELEIFELNRQLDLDLPEADDHHTLAGFLLERLQHIPAPGEALSFQGLQFEITVMAGPRIDRVRLILPNLDEVSD
ncbi:MAG: hemolysin family protein [Parasynechococcus sp.]|jgi:CBS domain containing-hemolysin-like protein|uniref:hemolysin family protein n=1 Tax=Parasynechococcus sp. TaxID=3101203 RepID=UPI000E1A7E98|nr:HlyC/CorC family transporter [Synechococcus sp. BS307-5m-G35]MDA7435044.1 hemolysin family protein [Synechococcus sp. AH-601-J22]RCL57931.1 MAG: HlyC/CorC family transporter [Synechococcus sp. MED-G69]